MELNKIDKSKLKKNFLKQIILRADYVGVLQSEMDLILSKAKRFLKDSGFNKYEEKTNNEINIELDHVNVFQNSNPIKEVKNSKIFRFINENVGYTLDLSTNFICMTINTIKYVPFEEYAKIFKGLIDICANTIEFYTVNRIGIRKINFCFLKNKDSINKYFSEKYFDCYNVYNDADVLVVDRKTNFKLEKNKVNLFSKVEKGFIENDEIYVILLDIDLYSDEINEIQEILKENEKLADLNEKIFTIYVDTFNDELYKVLSSENEDLPDDILGVNNNE